MGCRLCKWFCDRFLPPETLEGFWHHVYDWEDEYTSTWEPRDENDDRRERAYSINTIFADDPAAAFQLSQKIAVEGSIHAMRWAAWFRAGKGAAEANPELRKSYLIQAYELGSYGAGLEYCSLLFSEKRHDEWRAILAKFVGEGFVPALFYQAWYEFKLAPGRQTSRQLRSQLTQAAEAGHPGARGMLGGLSMRGHFGLGEIANGFRMIRGVSGGSAS